MNKRILRVGVVVLAVVMALALAASALAQGPGGQDGAQPDRGEELGQRLIDKTAELTGVPSDEILAQLREGESLLDIAEANGVEREVVIDLLKDEIGAEIDAVLSDGDLGAFWDGVLSRRVERVLERAMDPSLLASEHPRTARVMREVVQILSDEGGMLPRAIWRDALSGSTLAEIAAAEGVDVDALLADVRTEIVERLESAVEDGWLTAEERDRAVSQLSVALPVVVNEPLPALWNTMRDNAADRVDATLVGVIADLAEVEVDELLDEPFTGQSLKEIAESYGLDPDTVLAETRDRVTDAINQAVADGYLTQAQADSLLDGLGDRLDRRFESVYWPLQQWLASHMRAQGRMWR